MIVIDDNELRETLCQPHALYDALTSWSHFKPKEAIVPGDCELIMTDMMARGCAVACTLVHSRREAFLILLSPDDIRAFGDRLAALEPEMGSALMNEFAAVLGGRR